MKKWINIERLVKKIDDFTLGPIDLTFEADTVSVIIGENGAGKSSFLKTLMHLLPLNEGNITIFDSSIIKEEKWKHRIAYQEQTAFGLDAFTGKQLMSLIASLYKTWDQAYFQALVEEFNIPLDKKYGKLSQGVQQKLNIALTLSRDTEIVLLDEPTSFLDIPTKQKLMDILVQWMERGEKLLIISSHQVEDIRKLADYLIILHEGKLVGKFEKEQFSTLYRRYWLDKEIVEKVPGEIERKGDRIIVTKHPEATERFLKERNIGWLNEEKLGLEESISQILTEKRTS